jgi:hypothetical protein
MFWVGCQGGFLLPPNGGLLLALAGGGDYSHEDGWSFAPPIFSFSCQKKKRKRAVHGPKEKKK